jgi:hypothetical protein
MATILTKRSNTASSVPLAADLTNSTSGAELAVNTADKRLFTKDSGGTVVELGTNPSSLTLNGGTANGVPYLNGSKVLTTGSALQFDGSNLGLGVTPSAWGGFPAIQFTNNYSVSALGTMKNAYYDGSSYKYITSSYASQYQQDSLGKHIWSTAPSGTAGNAISFTQAMTLDASGSLMLGMTSANEIVSIYKSANTYIGLYNSTSGTSGSDGGYLGLAGSDLELRNKESGNVTLWTANTERARIDSSGNLLVGTTSSGGEIGRLTVKQGADADNGGLRLIAPNSTNAWAPRTGSDSQFYFGYNGTSKAKIDNSSGAYSALSDARLKENVQESVKGLSEILALRSVEYTFIDDEAKTPQVGFIAQEVESVIPEVVSTPTSSNQYYGLNYAGVVPVLVKAIQEQQAIISAQQAALDSLKARLDAANL